MITDLFLPARYGSYFLSARRSAGIMITGISVRATVIRSVRTQRIIEQLIEEPINQDQSIPLVERLVVALQKVVSQIPAETALVAIIPSSQVIFKIIMVPLMSLEKIKLLVPFEIEASLPFPLSVGCIDSILLYEDVPHKKAHVLVAATTRTVLEEQRALFAAVGRLPCAITTDVVALCGFLINKQQISEHKAPTITLCVDQKITVIIVSEGTHILGLRTITQGIYDIIVGGNVQEEALALYVRTIVSTAKNFLRTAYGKALEAPHLIICGFGAEERTLCAALTEHWNATCELLTINKILHDGTIVSNHGLTNAFLIPTITALPADMTDDFNLDQASAQASYNRIIMRQITCAAVLIGLMFFSFFMTRFMVARSLRTAITSSENEALSVLQHHIPGLKIPAGASLEKANKRALDEVEKNKEIWFSLSSQNRFAVLLILQELSKRINRDDLALELHQLLFHDDKKLLILEGKVQEFSALTKLEKNLRESPMFTILKGPLQTLDFTLEIKLNLASEDIT